MGIGNSAIWRSFRPRLVSIWALSAAVTPTAVVECIAIWSIIVVLDVKVSTVLVSAEPMRKMLACWGVVGGGVVTHRAVLSRALASQVELARSNTARRVKSTAFASRADSAFRVEFAGLLGRLLSFPGLAMVR